MEGQLAGGNKQLVSRIEVADHAPPPAAAGSASFSLLLCCSAFEARHHTVTLLTSSQTAQRQLRVASRCRGLFNTHLRCVPELPAAPSVDSHHPLGACPLRAGADLLGRGVRERPGLLQAELILSDNAMHVASWRCHRLVRRHLGKLAYSGNIRGEHPSVSASCWPAHSPCGGSRSRPRARPAQRPPRALHARGPPSKVPQVRSHQLTQNTLTNRLFM